MKMKTALTLLGLASCVSGSDKLTATDVDVTLDKIQTELTAQYNSDWLGLSYEVRAAALMLDNDACQKDLAAKRKAKGSNAPIDLECKDELDLPNGKHVIWTRNYSDLEGELKFPDLETVQVTKGGHYYKFLLDKAMISHHSMTRGKLRLIEDGVTISGYEQSFSGEYTYFVDGCSIHVNAYPELDARDRILFSLILNGPRLRPVSIEDIENEEKYKELLPKMSGAIVRGHKTMDVDACTDEILKEMQDSAFLEEEEQGECDSLIIDEETGMSMRFVHSAGQIVEEGMTDEESAVIVTHPDGQVYKFEYFSSSGQLYNTNGLNISVPNPKSKNRWRTVSGGKRMFMHEDTETHSAGFYGDWSLAPEELVIAKTLTGIDFPTHQRFEILGEEHLNPDATDVENRQAQVYHTFQRDRLCAEKEDVDVVKESTIIADSLHSYTEMVQYIPEVGGEFFDGVYTALNECNGNLKLVGTDTISNNSQEGYAVNKISNAFVLANSMEEYQCSGGSGLTIKAAQTAFLTGSNDMTTVSCYCEVWQTVNTAIDYFENSRHIFAARREAATALMSNAPVVYIIAGKYHVPEIYRQIVRNAPKGSEVNIALPKDESLEIRPIMKKLPDNEGRCVQWVSAVSQ